VTEDPVHCSLRVVLAFAKCLFTFLFRETHHSKLSYKLCRHIISSFSLFTLSRLSYK
jgi:hypothetical protein